MAGDTPTNIHQMYKLLDRVKADVNARMAPRADTVQSTDTPHTSQPRDTPEVDHPKARAGPAMSMSMLGINKSMVGPAKASGCGWDTTTLTPRKGTS